MSNSTHPLQHISGNELDRRPWRSRRHCQHKRQNNHQSPLCWWHRWLSRTGRRSGKISSASRQSLHSLRHRQQCQEDQLDDKQPQRHQHRDQSEWTEARDSHMLQVPRLSYNWLGFQAWHAVQNSTDDSRIDKVKPVLNDSSISVGSKIRLMRSLVTSIFLYACEKWFLTAELQKRIRAMKMKCYRIILCILYKDHVTTEEVCS